VENDIHIFKNIFFRENKIFQFYKICSFLDLFPSCMPVASHTRRQAMTCFDLWFNFV